MVAGFFLLRPVPPPTATPVGASTLNRRFSHEVGASPHIVVSESNDSSHTPLLAGYGDNVADVERTGSPAPHLRHGHTSRASVELSPTRDGHPILPPLRTSLGTRSRSEVTVRSTLSQAASEILPHIADNGLTNVSGRELFREADFWLLFSIMILLSGTGLMCELRSPI
jgi:hypothetical protein